MDDTHRRHEMKTTASNPAANAAAPTMPQYVIVKTGGDVERDPAYDWISPLPQPVEAKRGSQCGECGMKFEYGRGYGYCCGNPRCPTGFRTNR